MKILLVAILILATIALRIWDMRRRIDECIPITAEDIHLQQDGDTIRILYVNRETNRPDSQVFPSHLVELLREKRYDAAPEIIIHRNGLKDTLKVELHLPADSSIQYI